MEGESGIKFVRKPRESQFELIRILAQFFIVFYHLLMYFVFPLTDNTLYKALWLPFHIGVILFILISGYFGIKSSFKGFIKLIGMMFVLYVPIQFLDFLLFNEGKSIHDFIKLSLFISCTPFWFMRTYVFLYLFAPIINKYLKDITLKRRLYILSVLFFISYYIGFIRSDSSLLDGKNLPTFLFIYVVGNTLYAYKEKWQNFKFSYLIISYTLLNICLVLFFTYGLPNRIVNAIYVRVFFSYCSVGLLLNELLFFMIIGKTKFRSTTINWIAKSSLTIYMIHCSNLVLMQIIGPSIKKILDLTNNDIHIIFYTFLLTITILIGCVIIDNFLNPVWKEISKIGDVIEKKSNKFIASI